MSTDRFSLILMVFLISLSFLLSGCMDAEGVQRKNILSSDSIDQNNFKITELDAVWIVTARGLTDAEGQMWVPQIKLTLKNTSSNDIDSLYLKARFFDSDKIIKGDEVIEAIDSIPNGFSKGPIFLEGSVGFSSDWPFLSMAEDSSENWRFDLFISDSYGGPWAKIESGVVEIPESYKDAWGKN